MGTIIYTSLKADLHQGVVSLAGGALPYLIHFLEGIALLIHCGLQGNGPLWHQLNEKLPFKICLNRDLLSMESK